ncbi:LysR family transcriptional regulator [Sporosarcina sp. Te-1]|uniref:LysR family transcriptional regulator n=1 Tax=Sporosarcina sp. Te-1 TaxID=2818390 RepID=UPI001A9FC164|nr:LysR family transcriptional regulator [Sporosarcina sp. Te-1]QTD40074.1 LysR family transcriptional regulator [Sporosarcina sp. Te-1]
MVSKLDLYRIFSIVGKNQSFSKAARVLFMSQPAVSQAIMQLENELSTRLFNRTPKGVTPTTEGTLLLEYVNSAINLIEIGEEKMAEFKNLTIGELRVGVGDTISKYFLLPKLEAFRNRYPSLKLKIVNGTTDELISFLKSGEVDIGICNLPIHDASLHVTPCLDIHDTFVYGEKYQKLLARPIDFHELAKLPLIFLEPSSNSRKYVEEFLLAKGVKIEPEFELGSHDLVVEFARINMGIACVTKEFTEDYLERGILREVQLSEQIPHRSIGVCSLKSVPLSPASTKFVELIERM